MSEIGNAFKSMSVFNDSLSGRLFDSTLAIIDNQKFMQSQLAQLIVLTGSVGNKISSLRQLAPVNKINSTYKSDNSSDKKPNPIGLDTLKSFLGKDFFGKSNVYFKIATAIFEKMHETNIKTALPTGQAKSYGLSIEKFQALDVIAKSYGSSAENIGDAFLGFKRDAWQLDNLEQYPEKKNGLDSLGIKSKDLVGLSDFDKFKKIIDRAVLLRDEPVASKAVSDLLGDDVAKLVNYLRSTGSNLTDNMVKEQHYSFLTQGGADGALSYATAIGHLSTVWDSGVAEVSGRIGGVIAPAIEWSADSLRELPSNWLNSFMLTRMVIDNPEMLFSHDTKKQIPLEEQNKLDKAEVLRMYTQNSMTRYGAKIYANEHGLRAWFDEKVNQPGMLEKLNNKKQTLTTTVGLWGRRNLDEDESKKLISVVDGDPNQISSKQEKEQSTEQQSITPKTNTQPKDHLPLSTTLAQVSVENLRPVINDQSNKYVDVHVYAAAGQSEMDIANNIVARVNDLDIFNGVSGNNAMYDLAGAY